MKRGFGQALIRRSEPLSVMTKEGGHLQPIFLTLREIKRITCLQEAKRKAQKKNFKLYIKPWTKSEVATAPPA